MPGTPNKYKVLASSMSSDAEQLLIQKQGGGFLAIAFVKSATAEVTDTMGGDTFGAVASSVKSQLIDQCLGAEEVDFVKLNEMAKQSKG